MKGGVNFTLLTKPEENRGRNIAKHENINGFSQICKEKRSNLGNGYTGNYICDNSVNEEKNDYCQPTHICKDNKCIQKQTKSTCFVYITISF